MRALIVAAAFCGLSLVAASALGAHLVFAGADIASPQDSIRSLAAEKRWNQAVMFGFVHTLAALIVAGQSLRRGDRSDSWAIASGWAFVAGVALFSGIQMLRISVLGGQPPSPGTAAATWQMAVEGLGPLTPAGGLCLMAGWALLGVSAIRRGPRQP